MDFMKNAIVTTRKMEDILKHKGTPILKYTIEYPQFLSMRHLFAMQKMNLYYKKTAADFLRFLKTTMLADAISDYENSIKNGYPVHVYEGVLNYNVTYNRNCTISLYLDRYEYMGGAHGGTIRSSQTWDLDDAKQLPLKALFPGNLHYIADLKTQIKAQIKAQNQAGTGVYFEDYEELVDKTFDPKQFYLTPEGIVIYFQQYDIAPYASGIPTFSIPYKTVNAQKPYCNG